MLQSKLPTCKKTLSVLPGGFYKIQFFSISCQHQPTITKSQQLLHTNHRVSIIVNTLSRSLMPTVQLHLPYEDLAALFLGSNTA